MKLKTKRRYFIRYLCTFAILFAIIIAKTSCKKSDLLISKNSSQQQADINKFFNLPSNTNPAVATIAAELERQNQLTGFISQIANTAGFPVWDKSTVSLLKDESQNLNSVLQDYQGSNTCVLIPMVLEDANIVNAFIAATTINDSITIRLYYRNDYKAYPFQSNQPANSITTAEEFASQMILFDNAVFGYINFEVKDKRLFNTSLDYTDTSHIRKTVNVSGLSSQTSGNNLQTCLDVTTTTISNHCPYPANQCPNINTGVQGPCDNCEQSCANYSTSTVSYCTGGTGTGTGGGDNWPTSPPPNIPNYPGGSGSGGDNPTGNCVVGALILNGFAPPNPCNPPGGGNPLPPIPSNVLWLINTLNLNPTQVDFLLQNLARATEVYNYLEEETNAERKENSIEHLEFMRANAQYFNFVQNHAAMGNPNKMWWDDIFWLRQINFNFPNEDVFNLWNEAAKPNNPKPLAEFNNYCDGITHIMTLSINDPQKRERMGYITLDGKFIFTSVGSADETKVNVKIYNGIVYYTYKTNKSAPLLSYYGMIIKNGEYCIPIRTNIHNHILDGNPNEVPIETDPQKSNGDDNVAQLIQKQTGINNFRLFVIEAKTNGKYITAAFDRVDNNYQIINNNILLNEVCNGIW